MVDLKEAIASLSDYNSVRDFLYALRYHGAKYGLERMEKIARILNNPQDELPCIHVAGTNGKGSTCSMIEAIYRTAGYKTGFYSSPHLIRQGERIQVDREIMSEDEIVSYTKEMISKFTAECMDDFEYFPSFFEFMTAMGFLKFQKEAVDVALIETGLGGRLDATNILKPLVSVITSISLDHTAILGDNLKQIAAEKAGILKQDTPVVMGLLPEEAEAVIRQKAADLNCPVYSVAEKWGTDFDAFPLTNLKGPHQRINAAMATLVVEILESTFPLTGVNTETALMKVDWPGRWEELTLNNDLQPVILDSSHNEEGAKMLVSNLQELVGKYDEKPIIVTGSLGEDRAQHLISILSEYADSLILVQPHQPRAVDPVKIIEMVPASFEGEVSARKVSELFSQNKCLISTKKKQPVLVTGSIYLIGEVSDLIKSDQTIDQQCLQDVI